MSSLKAAVLDLNNGTPNQGMRCIREFLDSASALVDGLDLSYDVFDVRVNQQVPDLSYDIYISSGGPGSPFDGEDKLWEQRYFDWAHTVMDHNRKGGRPKHVLFICYSFQLMCRCFSVAEVTRRKSMSFGITPIHMTDEGIADSLYQGLSDPFFAADFRDWQVVQPNLDLLNELGGSVLSIEKERPHIPLERATTAIRMSPEMVGVQFHPEADVDGMLVHFKQDHRRQHVIEEHGEDKYYETLERMQHPDFLARTHATILPNFLRNAVECMVPEHSWSD